MNIFDFLKMYGKVVKEPIGDGIVRWKGKNIREMYSLYYNNKSFLGEIDIINKSLYSFYLYIIGKPNGIIEDMLVDGRNTIFMKYDISIISIKMGYQFQPMNLVVIINIKDHFHVFVLHHYEHNDNNINIFGFIIVNGVKIRVVSGNTNEHLNWINNFMTGSNLI